MDEEFQDVGHRGTYVGGSYSVAAHYRKTLVPNAQRALENVAFDTFVAQGASGMLVAPILAFAMEKNCVAVRKPGENEHTEQLLEGFVGRRYVIVDDFIETGRTIQRIVNAVRDTVTIDTWDNKETPLDTTFAGVYLYQRQAFMTPQQTALRIRPLVLPTTEVFTK
jgi:hypoxanthine phosphoribosyltransferase